MLPRGGCSINSVFTLVPGTRADPRQPLEETLFEDTIDRVRAGIENAHVLAYHTFAPVGGTTI
jgi:hypothetical protein